MPPRSNAKALAPESGLSTELLEKLRKAEAEAPRYLFRGWTSESGGNKRLNTVRAITPLAFLYPRAPASVEHLSTTRFQELWNGHFSGKFVRTVFSSWSHSFSIAMQFALARRLEDAHISIIDTTLLEEHNRVFFTGSKDLRIPCLGARAPIAGGQHEYLVFGVITGKALCPAVRCGPATDLGRVFYSMSRCYGWPGMVMDPAERTLEQSVTTAKRIGKACGTHWELVMVCCVLSYLLAPPGCTGYFPISAQDLKQTAVQLALEYDVPRDWLADKKVTLLTVEGGFAAYPDAVRAVQFMRSVAENKYKKQPRARRNVSDSGQLMPHATSPYIGEAPAAGGDSNFTDVVAIDTSLTDAHSAWRDVYWTPHHIANIPKELEIDMTGWPLRDTWTGDVEISEGSLSDEAEDRESFSDDEEETSSEDDSSGDSDLEMEDDTDPVPAVPRMLKELRIAMVGWNSYDEDVEMADA